MSKPIEIPISKFKSGFSIVASVAFLFISIWFTFFKDFQADLPPFFNENIWLVKVIGILSIVFFSYTLRLGLRKYSENKIGLRIDDLGLTDNTNPSSVGLIKWDDIIGIKEMQIISNRFFIVEVKNPKYYIEKADTEYKKKLLQSNFKAHGTPITITSGALAIEFQELDKLLKNEFYKRNLD